MSKLRKLGKSTQTVCASCGSHKVQARAWVRVNTRKFVGFVGDEIVDNWCNRCNDHVELKDVPLATSNNTMENCPNCGVKLAMGNCDCYY